MARRLNYCWFTQGCMALVASLFLLIACPGFSQDPVQPANTEEGSGEYVFAGDLKKQLQKIDPNARVEWTGSALRVEAAGQKFSLFPQGQSGRKMVVNGAIEKSPRPLRVANDEIYVPQEAMVRIAQQLEKAGATGAATPTPEPTSTPEVSPTPTVTPIPSMSPVMSTPTPTPLATLTPTPTPTPTPVLAATYAPTPTPVPTLTPEPTPTLTPKITPPPTPIRTLTPAPSPTPRKTPTPTPRPTAVRRTPTPVKPAQSAAATRDIYRQALADRNALSEIKLPERKLAQLESLASAGQVSRVVIHVDDSALGSSSPRASQAVAKSFDLASRVKKLLEERRIEVVSTHPSQNFVPMSKALETIGNSNAQVLLIISVGESEFADISGYRILYPSDTVDYDPRQGTVARETGEELPLAQVYRPFQQGSKVLATALAGALRNVLGMEPNGLNPAPMYLARRAPMASAHVVAGYLSNPADTARLNDQAKMNDLAKGIVDAIAQYSEHLGTGGRR